MGVIIAIPVVQCDNESVVREISALHAFYNAFEGADAKIVSNVCHLPRESVGGCAGEEGIILIVHAMVIEDKKSSFLPALDKGKPGASAAIDLRLECGTPSLQQPQGIGMVKQSSARSEATSLHAAPVGIRG